MSSSPRHQLSQRRAVTPDFCAALGLCVGTLHGREFDCIRIKPKACRIGRVRIEPLREPTTGFYATDGGKGAMTPGSELKADVNYDDRKLAEVYHLNAKIQMSISKCSDWDDVMRSDLQSDLVSTQLMPGVDEA